jgi:hypothetical protein
LIKAHCEICNSETNQPFNQPTHFCERCAAFNEDFLEKRREVAEKGMMRLGREMEAFRHKYLSEVVIPFTKKQGAA